MVKKKRKLSAYNRHMSAEMRKGRSFKQAVASWRGGRSGSKKRGVSMARKKYSRARKVYRRHKRSINLMSTAIGAGGYAVLEPKLDQYLAQYNVGVSDDIVKIALGYALTKKAPWSAAKEIGKAMVYIGINRLAQAKFAGGSSAQASSSGRLF